MNRPIATIALILANLAVFQLELTRGGLDACYAYGLIPAEFLVSGDAAPVFSSLFLHDPETVLHLGCNMVFLAVFGTVVEREIGALRFATLFTAAGVAGALLHVAVDPGATTPLVGASGAIFGVMAMAGALRPHLLGFVIAFGAIEISHAFTGGAEGVSFGCHIGGLTVGAIAAALWDDEGALETA